MDFKKLSEKDLLQAYRGYCKAAETGAVGEDDFDGIFYMAVDEREKRCKGLGFPATTLDLLSEIAQRWYNEHQYDGTMMADGTELWHVCEDTSEIKRAIVTSVQYKDGKLDSFGAEFPDSDDFAEFCGSAIGSCFFFSEAKAKLKVLEKEG